MTDKPLTARIEVFRPGTFRPMSGDPISYSAADLKAIADAYDPDLAPAPVVVGHPDTDAPAFGWIEGLDYDASAGRLFANLHQIEPAFADAVKAGRYRKVSMAFFAPGQGHNPVPGTWYPKHVGFLGAAAPAVSGLTPVKFAADAPAGAVFTAAFGERGFEETASLLRMLREFFIEKFGMEDADKALPSYQIEWLSDMEVTGGKALGPAYAGITEPPLAIPPKPEKEPAVTQQNDPAFAAREANLTEREQALAARERDLAHADNMAFAETLIADGKLLPASKDKVVAILDALPAEQSVSFAEGEKLTPAVAIRAVLEAQPKVVNLGQMTLPEGVGTGQSIAFAADGKPVDAAGLETHNKALDYQRQHPGTVYLDAVRAVS